MWTGVKAYTAVLSFQLDEVFLTFFCSEFCYSDYRDNIYGVNNTILQNTIYDTYSNTANFVT